jgi:hypothetical protein
LSIINSTESLSLVRRASTAFGFVASVTEITNYQRIWTRDGVIIGLAALLSGDEALIRTFHSTLKTIFDHQLPGGFLSFQRRSADGQSQLRRQLRPRG